MCCKCGDLLCATMYDGNRYGRCVMHLEDGGRRMKVGGCGLYADVHGGGCGR